MNKNQQKTSLFLLVLCSHSKAFTFQQCRGHHMEGHANGEPNSSWFGDNIEIWANMGWDISGIEQYLLENSDNATEAL